MEAPLGVPYGNQKSAMVLFLEYTFTQRDPSSSTITPIIYGKCLYEVNIYLLN